PPAPEIRPSGMEWPLNARYLLVLGEDAAADARFGFSTCNNSTSSDVTIPCIPMRIAPSLSYSSVSDWSLSSPGNFTVTCTSLSSATYYNGNVRIFCGTAGSLVAGVFASLRATGTASRIYLSSEL
ncbi:MAG TPA: hypothetical protein VIJ14_09100, partial [Rhabdochlamydiaceae bacterium]